MPIGEVAILIGAIAGLIVAVGGVVVPITIAMLNLRKPRDEKPPVEQGQPVAPKADALLAERDRRRRAERERDAYRRALNAANDALRAADQPLHHPDL